MVQILFIKLVLNVNAWQKKDFVVKFNTAIHAFDLKTITKTRLFKVF